MDRRRLCADLGRDDRYVRLNGEARRGLRGIEIGRVCLEPHGDDGSETESDVEVVVVVVELQVVEKDKLEWVERFELVVESELEVVGSNSALGSCPQMPAYWTPRCSSSVVSSLLH